VSQVAAVQSVVEVAGALSPPFLKNVLEANSHHWEANSQEHAENTQHRRAANKAPTRIQTTTTTRR